MHGIVGGAQFEVELEFAFEEVAGAVGTVFVLYFWVGWGIVWVGGIVLHDDFIYYLVYANIYQWGCIGWL